MKTLTSQEYWTKHTVSVKKQFTDANDSLNSFLWRSLQYLGYLELMPVNQATDKVVLDYGCGPGNDLVGFSHYSKPKKLIGMDVSETALSLSANRLNLHNFKAELIKIDENDDRLPFEDESVDIIHSSGVLHHTPDPVKILKEFKRILKPDGYAQIMVYNYNSVWMHLYVAYLKMIEDKIINSSTQFEGMTKRQAFAKLTDGNDCPISECYKPEEFIAIVSQSGLKSEFLGSAVSGDEMNWLRKRYDALRNIHLDEESRRFLYELTFDHRGFPLYRGNVAGVDACFKLIK